MTTDIQQVPAVAQQQRTSTAVTATRAGFFDLESFELMQRVSKAFASSDLVPQQYRGNLANCMIALDMAQRIGANPLMTMQNLYVVHGTPGWSSKFLIATINACGRCSSLRYEWKGEPGTPDHGCRAWAVELSTGERLDGIWVTWKMVKAEGWDSKNGSKWKTMPDQMFVYRAAAFWQRAYAPELAMGLQTVEDLHDVIDVTPTTIAPQPTVVHVPTPTPAGRRMEAAPQPETIDQHTGEIAQQQSTSLAEPIESADRIAEDLQRAATIDALDDVAALFSDYDADTQATLGEIYRRRREELSANQAQPEQRRQRRASASME